jgi:hypothetical protein
MLQEKLEQSTAPQKHPPKPPSLEGSEVQLWSEHGRGFQKEPQTKQMCADAASFCVGVDPVLDVSLKGGQGGLGPGAESHCPASQGAHGVGRASIPPSLMHKSHVLHLQGMACHTFPLPGALVGLVLALVFQQGSQLSQSHHVSFPVTASAHCPVPTQILCGKTSGWYLVP